MMGRFFQCTKVLYSSQAPSAVLAAIRDAIDRENEYKIKLRSALPNGLSFDVRPAYIMIRNSFLPHVEIDVRGTENRTAIHMHFGLQKSVKVLCWGMAVFGLLMEVLLLCMDGIRNPFLLLPLAMALCMILFCAIGFHLSLRPIFALLRDAIPAAPWPVTGDEQMEGK